VCCSVLQCVAVCCSVLQCVAVCCSVLQCVAVCCNVMQCGAGVLQCVDISHASNTWRINDCSTHPHTATHWKTLQHAATHPNTLQHTSTHSNTPQLWKKTCKRGLCNIWKETYKTDLLKRPGKETYVKHEKNPVKETYAFLKEPYNRDLCTWHLYIGHRWTQTFTHTHKRRAW